MPFLLTFDTDFGQCSVGIARLDITDFQTFYRKCIFLSVHFHTNVLEINVNKTAGAGRALTAALTSGGDPVGVVWS